MEYDFKQAIIDGLRLAAGQCSRVEKTKAVYDDSLGIINIVVTYNTAFAHHNLEEVKNNILKYCGHAVYQIDQLYYGLNEKMDDHINVQFKFRFHDSSTSTVKEVS